MVHFSAQWSSPIFSIAILWMSSNKVSFSSFLELANLSLIISGYVFLQRKRFGKTQAGSVKSFDFSWKSNPLSFKTASHFSSWSSQLTEIYLITLFKSEKFPILAPIAGLIGWHWKFAYAYGYCWSSSSSMSKTIDGTSSIKVSFDIFFLCRKLLDKHIATHLTWIDSLILWSRQRFDWYLLF